MTGYSHHYHQARKQFIDWFYNKHHPNIDQMPYELATGDDEE